MKKAFDAIADGLRDATEDARMEHLVNKHGLVAVECPRCSGLGCETCENEGVMIRLPSGPNASPCGEKCPLMDALQ